MTKTLYFVTDKSYDFKRRHNEYVAVTNDLHEANRLVRAMPEATGHVTRVVKERK